MNRFDSAWLKTWKWWISGKFVFTQAGEEFENTFKDRAGGKSWLWFVALSSVLECSSLRHCLDSLGSADGGITSPETPAAPPAHPRSHRDPKVLTHVQDPQDPSCRAASLPTMLLVQLLSIHTINTTPIFIYSTSRAITMGDILPRQTKQAITAIENWIS